MENKRIPLMPKEYIGELLKNKNPVVKTIPRKWTKNEIDWCVDLKNRGFTNEEISVSISRDPISTQIKMKRIGKTKNTYNHKHLDEKYSVNMDFLSLINPKTILDLYCGEKSFYKQLNKYDVFSNDKEISFEADLHQDALKAICFLYHQNKNYDLIDLDPFGSSFDCFDLAIKMAKRGLIITFGEMGHKRFKRLDFVRERYGISDIDNFSVEPMIEVIKKIGRINKKMLNPKFIKNWNGISRVYFEIERFKITEQWDNKTQILS